MRRPSGDIGKSGISVGDSAPTRPALGRNYATYALLIFLSFAGSIGHVIAVTWLLLRGPNGPTYVALAFMVSAIPPILLFRLVRRRAHARLTTSLARLDLAQAALALSVPILAYAGFDLPRGVLLGQEFLLSCCGAFVFPLARLLLVRVVPSGAALAANSTSAAVFQLGNSVGAVQGGLLVAGAGPYVAMVVNAATFAASAIGLVFFVRPVSEQAPQPQALDDGGGDSPNPTPRHLRSPRRRRISLLIIGTVVLLTVQRLFLGSIGPLVDTHLNGDAALQGLLQSAFTVGGVGGGLLIARHSSLVPAKSSVRVVLLFCAAAFVTLAVASWVPVVLVACVMVGVTVSFWSVFHTQVQTAGGPARESDLLARIGLGQSVGALTMFAGASAATLVVEPRFTMLALGLILVSLGLITVREINSP